MKTSPIARFCIPALVVIVATVLLGVVVDTNDTSGPDGVPDKASADVTLAPARRVTVASNESDRRGDPSVFFVGESIRMDGVQADHWELRCPSCEPCLLGSPNNENRKVKTIVPDIVTGTAACVECTIVAVMNGDNDDSEQGITICRPNTVTVHLELPDSVPYPDGLELPAYASICSPTQGRYENEPLSATFQVRRSDSDALPENVQQVRYANLANVVAGTYELRLSPLKGITLSGGLQLVDSPTMEQRHLDDRQHDITVSWPVGWVYTGSVEYAIQPLEPDAADRILPPNARIEFRQRTNGEDESVVSELPPLTSGLVWPDSPDTLTGTVDDLIAGITYEAVLTWPGNCPCWVTSTYAVNHEITLGSFVPQANTEIPCKWPLSDLGVRCGNTIDLVLDVGTAHFDGIAIDDLTSGLWLSNGTWSARHCAESVDTLVEGSKYLVHFSDVPDGVYELHSKICSGPFCSLEDALEVRAGQQTGTWQVSLEKWGEICPAHTDVELVIANDIKSSYRPGHQWWLESDGCEPILAELVDGKWVFPDAPRGSYELRFVPDVSCCQTDGTLHAVATVSVPEETEITVDWTDLHMDCDRMTSATVSLPGFGPWCGDESDGYSVTLQNTETEKKYPIPVPYGQSDISNPTELTSGRYTLTVPSPPLCSLCEPHVITVSVPCPTQDSPGPVDLPGKNQLPDWDCPKGKIAVQFDAYLQGTSTSHTAWITNADILDQPIREDSSAADSNASVTLGQVPPGLYTLHVRSKLRPEGGDTTCQVGEFALGCQQTIYVGAGKTRDVSVTLQSHNLISTSWGSIPLKSLDPQRDSGCDVSTLYSGENPPDPDAVSVINTNGNGDKQTFSWERHGTPIKHDGYMMFTIIRADENGSPSSFLRRVFIQLVAGQTEYQTNIESLCREGLGDFVLWRADIVGHSENGTYYVVSPSPPALLAHPNLTSCP